MTGSVEYEVVASSDRIEVRKYPSMILATVRTPYGDAAFSILFNYISGNNQAGEKMPMTAPVVSTASGTRIDMTAPVISDAGSFSFVLPQEYDVDTAPRPSDPRIELVPVPPRYVAVIRFSGRAYMREVMEREKELLAWLSERSIRPMGAPFLMRYNSPFVPGFMRRNEVGVVVPDDDIEGGMRL